VISDIVGHILTTAPSLIYLAGDFAILAELIELVTAALKTAASQAASLGSQ